ncbi:hypothetical protein M514_14463 [Trichuris suis]|uniref:Uncharacterized protein n=1 Tax=Trichuris suis TaxID=68888 RepID=A0A085NUH7_9BILA|nr:hypothetical protein M514_14463 [Trichuris suis]
MINDSRDFPLRLIRASNWKSHCEEKVAFYTGLST